MKPSITCLSNSATRRDDEQHRLHEDRVVQLVEVPLVPQELVERPELLRELRRVRASATAVERPSPAGSRPAPCANATSAGRHRDIGRVAESCSLGCVRSAISTPSAVAERAGRPGLLQQVRHAEFGQRRQASSRRRPRTPPAPPAARTSPRAIRGRGRRRDDRAARRRTS